jgi:ABC-type microcin C transport system permease subunit YejB
MYQDAFVGSSMENGTTMITFDLRQHDFHQELGTQATLCWRKASSPIDVHALSTFHHPIPYRCILAQGAYLDAQNQRRYFTPAIKGVSPSQPMRHSVIRLACALAVVCGVSLRHIALLFSALFLIPMTTSSLTRWMDAIGTPLPPPEEMLQQ